MRHFHFVALFALSIFFLFIINARASETYIPPGEFINIADLSAMELIESNNFGAFIDVNKKDVSPH